jgi:GxxExxY protein
MNRGEINARSGQIVDSAIRVHSTVGPGLLESAYEACLAHELRKRGLRVRTQVPMPIIYDGVRIELGYRADLIVDDAIIVELKTAKRLLPIHEAQLLSYLKLSGLPVGLLINFHSVHLKNGIQRTTGEILPQLLSSVSSVPSVVQNAETSCLTNAER